LFSGVSEPWGVASQLASLDFKTKAPTWPTRLPPLFVVPKCPPHYPPFKVSCRVPTFWFCADGLAFTFLRAMGVPIGSSLVEESMVETAKDLMAQAAAVGKQLVVPVDSVCAASFPTAPMDIADTQPVDVGAGSAGIPDGWMGLDTGPNAQSRWRYFWKRSSLHLVPS
jgi:Phosphoglycerate kinase